MWGDSIFRKSMLLHSHPNNENINNSRIPEFCWKDLKKKKHNIWAKVWPGRSNGSTNRQFQSIPLQIKLKYFPMKWKYPNKACNNHSILQHSRWNLFQSSWDSGNGMWFLLWPSQSLMKSKIQNKPIKKVLAKTSFKFFTIPRTYDACFHHLIAVSMRIIDLWNIFQRSHFIL